MLSDMEDVGKGNLEASVVLFRGHLTDQVPFSIGQVPRDVGLTHLQVQQPPIKGP